MTRITAQLGTSESLLGQFELGDYDPEVIKSASSTMTVTQASGSTTDHPRTVTQTVSLAQAGSVTSTNPEPSSWAKFPARLAWHGSFMLLN